MSSHEAEIAELSATPVDADGVSAVAIGTCLWALAGATLWMFFRPTLAAHDATWWLWVCLVGFGLGLLGLPYVTRRRAVYRRHAARLRAGVSDGGELPRG